MADDFTERYAGLLTGSYDCVDRIVLNAYFSIGHNPGGFRCWWRRLHGGSDDQLDNTHLMRMAGRFARRVKAWAAANQVPVIYCTAGQRFTADLMTKVGNIKEGKTPTYEDVVDTTFAKKAIEQLGEWKGPICPTAAF